MSFKIFFEMKNITNILEKLLKYLNLISYVTSSSSDSNLIKIFRIRILQNDTDSSDPDRYTAAFGEDPEPDPITIFWTGLA